MGNKKSSKPAAAGSSARRHAPLLFIAAITAALATVYYVTKPPSTVSHAAAPATGVLIETKPVLSPGMFIGRAAQVYKVAAEIPKVIDSIFCYCYCKKNHGHKTLLTCFTNEHGAKCDVCMDEAMHAYDLYKEGKSLDEIVIAVDKKFYRPERPHGA